MNSGLTEIEEEIQTKSRRPPQVKSSKAQIHAKFHKIPTIHFEDQKLTSFSGLLIFQSLFRCLNLKMRLKQCFSHIKVSSIFGHHSIVLLLIVHLLIGFRRLREVDYYRDDPIVLRLLGLRKLPDTSTISRALYQIEAEGVDKYRQLSRELVTEALIRERLPRLTLDFDGSVLTTKGHKYHPEHIKGSHKYGYHCQIEQYGWASSLRVEKNLILTPEAGERPDASNT